MQDRISLTQGDLIKRLLDNLPTGYARNQVKTPNAKFTTPKGKKWLRITVIPGIKQNVQAGGSYKRTFGICVIDCFYPKGDGDQAQLSDVEEIQALYENQEFDNAKCQEVYNLALGDDESWYNQQVNINFYYEGA